MEHSASGASLKDLREQKRKEKLHHLRVHAHPAGTPENPRWLVAHHMSEDDPNPKEYDFSDGNEMIAHVADNAGVPADGQEGEQENG